jgi:hypothetical protein
MKRLWPPPAAISSARLAWYWDLMSASSTCCPSIGGHGRRGAELHERLALHMGADLQEVLGRKNTQGIDQGRLRGARDRMLYELSNASTLSVWSMGMSIISPCLFNKPLPITWLSTSSIECARVSHGRLPVTRMNIDYWAHWVVSVVALVAAIGIPIWQRRVTNADTIAGKRTLLLQSIMSAKSTIYVSKLGYSRLLTLGGEIIKPEQQAAITNSMIEMQKLHDRFETLHRTWSDYNDGKGLRELEQMLSWVDAMSADANDMAKASETIMNDALHITGRRT